MKAANASETSVNYAASNSRRQWFIIIAVVTSLLARVVQIELRFSHKSLALVELIIDIVGEEQEH
jgi:hypothetical protein